MTSWMKERDRLVAETQAFVQDVAAAKPLRPAPTPAAPAEPPLVPPKPPVPSRQQAAPAVTERDEIMRRVAAFKAHQHRLAKERETFYASVQSQIRSVLGHEVEAGGL